MPERDLLLVWEQLQVLGLKMQARSKGVDVPIKRGVQVERLEGEVRALSELPAWRRAQGLDPRPLPALLQARQRRRERGQDDVGAPGEGRQGAGL